MSQSDTSPYPTQSPNIVILVTGDRHAQYQHWADLIASVIWAHTQGQPYELVHGDARGIDRIAVTVACRSERNNPSRVIASEVTAFPAAWKAHGKAAGPRRNQQMLDYCLQRQREGAWITCLAFHPDLEHSKGTGHMVKIARAAGIPVETFDGRAVH